MRERENRRGKYKVKMGERNERNRVKLSYNEKNKSRLREREGKIIQKV